MIIRCVFVSGRRRRRRRRRRNGTYIQPPEGWASSPSEGGFMWVGGGRGVGIRLVWWDQGKHKDGLVYSMSNPLVEYTGWM